MKWRRQVKNLKSDLWQNLLSSLKARAHLHNVDDYHYHGGDDDVYDDVSDVYDKGNEVDDEDTSQPSSASSLLKSGSK